MAGDRTPRICSYITVASISNYDIPHEVHHYQILLSLPSIPSPIEDQLETGMPFKETKEQMGNNYEY